MKSETKIKIDDLRHANNLSSLEGIRVNRTVMSVKLMDKKQFNQLKLILIISW